MRKLATIQAIGVLKTEADRYGSVHFNGASIDQMLRLVVTPGFEGEVQIALEVYRLDDTDKKEASSRAEHQDCDPF